VLPLSGRSHCNMQAPCPRRRDTGQGERIEIAMQDAMRPVLLPRSSTKSVNSALAGHGGQVFGNGPLTQRISPARGNRRYCVSEPPLHICDWEMPCR
jgi:hypothetical protein